MQFPMMFLYITGVTAQIIPPSSNIPGYILDQPKLYSHGGIIQARAQEGLFWASPLHTRGYNLSQPRLHPGIFWAARASTVQYVLLLFLICVIAKLHPFVNCFLRRGYQSYRQRVYRFATEGIDREGDKPRSRIPQHKSGYGDRTHSR